MAETLSIGPDGSGVRGDPIFAPGRPHPAVTLQNQGTTTVYVDEDKLDPPTAGFAVSPGSWITWDADRPLYAACPTAGSITVAATISGGFDAGAVAAQLNAQGLAGDIASAISISGAPPIDTPAMIYANTQNVASGVAPNPSALIDVTKYNFLETWILESGVTTANTLFRRVTLSWYADLAGTLHIHDQSYTYGAYNGIQGIKLPIPGGAKSLQLTYTAATTVQTVSMSVGVTASTRMSSVPSSFNHDSNAVIWAGTPAESLGRDGIFEYSMTGAQAPGTTNMYPEVYEGPAQLVVIAGIVAAGGTYQVLLQDNVHGVTLAAVSFGPTAGGLVQVGYVDLIIPRRPLKIVSIIAGANTTNPSVVLTMTPW